MTTALTKQLLVDWDGDGVPQTSGAYEDVTTDLLQTRGVRMRHGRDQIRELSPLMAGFLEFVLGNTSLRYSDDNASSPIYGKVVPGRLTQAKVAFGQGYAQTVKNDSPSGYWRLGESSGTSAADASGNGNTGTYTGGVTLAQTGGIATELDGSSNTAALFDGTSGYVRAKAGKIVGGQTNLSIEAWVNTTVNPAGVCRTIYAERGGNDILRLGLIQSNQLQLVVRDDAGTINILTSNTTKTLNDGAWHHVVVTKTGTAVAFYVDGAAYGTGTLTATDAFALGTIESDIGRDPTTTTEYLPGYLDEVAAYPTALSAARVLAHYNAGRDQSVSDQQTYQHFEGYLQLPGEHPLRSDQNVSFSALDGAGYRLNAQDVETALWTSIATGTAIGKVLDAVGWPAGKRRIDAGVTTMGRWLATGVKGFAAIRDIVLTEGAPAIFFIDPADGYAVFYDRHHRLVNTASVSSQVTLRDTGTEPCYSRSDPKNGAENIVNSVRVNLKVWPAGTAGQALTVGGPALPVNVPVGGSITYDVSTSTDAFDSANASATATGGSISASLNRTSGKKATLTISNSGTTTATVSAVGVTATTYTLTVVSVKNSIDASASIAKYGERTLPDEFQPPFLSTQAEALNWADYVVSRYQEKVKQNTVALNNYASPRLVQAITRKISDKVTLVNSVTGSSEDYYVEQIERQWQPGGNFEAALGIEQASAQSYWRLGIAGYSELGVTTRLSF